MSLDRWIDGGFEDRPRYERGLSSPTKSPHTIHVVSCESTDCQRRDEPIEYWTDSEGQVVHVKTNGVVFSPTGARHVGCPDPHFAAFLKARGL